MRCTARRCVGASAPSASTGRTTEAAVSDPAMRCPVDEHLVTLVDLIQELRARGDHRYAAAVELRVCARCPQREASGRCASRDDGRCALSVFLPLVVEAIDEAEHGPRDANA